MESMTRKIRRFRNSEDKSLKEMVESRDPEIVYSILESIFWGIEKGLSAVECFEVETNVDIVTFKMARVEWMPCMEKLIEDMISYEDYEMCTKIQKYQKMLSQKRIK